LLRRGCVCVDVVYKDICLEETFCRGDVLYVRRLKRKNAYIKQLYCTVFFFCIVADGIHILAHIIFLAHFHVYNAILLLVIFVEDKKKVVFRSRSRIFLQQTHL
jgi:hypothetical protein